MFWMTNIYTKCLYCEGNYFVDANFGKKLNQK